jgi:catechol 2,3-dioxygenase-like lactoylglutathione lyase family enzyme
MIIGLHHTGLVVTDLDAAIAFYTTQQAFSVVSRFDLADTPENREMLELDDARARVAFLRGTLGAIELFEYAVPKHQGEPERQVYSAGIRHICLQQDLSDAMYDHFLAVGAASHARPSGLGTGNSYVYIRDPEGNIIELEGVPWAPAAADKPWFAHTAIVSPDMPRLLAFYAMLTGQEATRQGAFGPDPKFDRVAGIADVRFDGGWLRLSNAELEFWQYHQPQTTPAARRALNAPGWNHVCFESDDLDADYQRLLAQGMELHGTPQDVGSATVLFGRDPDGNVFELLQPAQGASLTVEAMMQEQQGLAVNIARSAWRERLAAGARGQ